VPRAGLSRAVVVDVGAQLADEAGLERLTLAGVAARVGVRLPSLYKHVGGLDDLQRGVAVLALRELAEQLSAAAIGRAEAQALRAFAGAYRRYAQERPGRYAATLRAPAPDDDEHARAAAVLVNIIFAVLRGYGLEDDGLVHATRMLRSSLHGFVALEAAGGFGLPESVDESFARLVDGLDAALRAQVPPTARVRAPSSQPVEITR
jgi:AcrR family transcriptional regulator